MPGLISVVIYYTDLLSRTVWGAEQSGTAGWGCAGVRILAGNLPCRFKKCWCFSTAKIKQFSNAGRTEQFPQGMKKPRSLQCCNVTQEEWSILLFPSCSLIHPASTVPVSASPVKTHCSGLEPSTNTDPSVVYWGQPNSLKTPLQGAGNHVKNLTD